jgi:hypothetical protein
VSTGERSVFAYATYEPAARTGVVVSVVAEGVTTAPAASAHHVLLVVPASGEVRANFFAPVEGKAGARLGTLRDVKNRESLLIGKGPGAAVRTVALDGITIGAFGLNDPGRGYGVYVG